MVNLPFHRKYRPADFAQIIGNKSLIESLQTTLSKEKGITTFLLQGPSGCGKTTLARIIGRHLGAKDQYIKELNISYTKGIDAARSIIRNAQFQPFSGDCNVYILNECFYKNTKIKIPTGEISIEDVKVGDLIYNIKGISTVNHVFKNIVPLDRVVKVKIASSNEIICSKDHLFLTGSSKWKEAINLNDKDVVFQYYGRERPSNENIYSKRQKKGMGIKKVRVESVEIYERGNNDRSFESIIGDKERDQGFIEFYDLEVKSHPSYFANGVVVHNCHKATSEFQNAMLEILEEPPRNTYFILCTTDPNKLLNTVKNRCTTYQVRKLRVSEISKLVTDVLVKEKNKGFPKKGIREIAYAADGCPRKALKLLDSVVDIRDEGKLLSAINDFSIAKKEVIELCRALLNGDSWKKVVNILKGLDEEPEDTRYAILGYMAAVLINKQNDRAFLVIEEFKESFMYTKKAGLISACYTICNM